MSEIEKVATHSSALQKYGPKAMICTGVALGMFSAVTNHLFFSHTTVPVYSIAQKQLIQETIDDHNFIWDVNESDQPWKNPNSSNIKEANLIVATGAAECSKLDAFAKSSDKPRTAMDTVYDSGVFDYRKNWYSLFSDSVYVDLTDSAKELCPNEYNVASQINDAERDHVNYGQVSAVNSFTVRKGVDSFYTERTYSDSKTIKYIAPGNYKLVNVSDGCKVQASDINGNIISSKIYPEKKSVSFTVTDKMSIIDFSDKNDLCGQLEDA